MLPAALIVLAFAASGALASVAAESPVKRPAGEARAPVLGKNFTVAQPAIEMIWIAPGTFLMSNPLGAGDDTWVTLTRGYWLGRTEVTQAQWQAVAEKIPGFENTPVPSFFKGSDRPAERITWDMAVAFCAKLTEEERAAGRLPDGYHYTLPTEAQWEYACRAGTTGKYAGDPEATTWHVGNSGGETHTVAQKQPNSWGLYDMQGNVSEWCLDWYGNYPGGRVEDPAGPPTGIYRVRRGISFGSPFGVSRSAIRLMSLAWVTGFYAGFRVALAPQITRGSATAALATP